MNRALKVIFCAIVVMLFYINTVYADQTNAVDIQKVDKVANGLDKLQEKIIFYFKFSKQDKLNYLYKLSEKRLSELQYVIDKKDYNAVEEIASRYQTYISNLSNFIISNRLDSRDTFNNMAIKHKNILNNLQAHFPFESGWWLVIQHDINILDYSNLELTKQI